MEEFLVQYWPLLIPLVAINYILVIAALVDLFRRERVAGERKWVWALVILFVNTVGPILYFALGRKE